MFGHSAKDLATSYRVAAVWAGQQGSFLLWAVTSTIFALLVGPFTGKYRRPFTIVYAVFLASLASILAYETPFNLIKDAIVDSTHVLRPLTGNGLTPALQNYWVIIHPPTIFMGFGSLTVPFAWAIAAMWTKDPIDWAQRVRPWALVSVSILGLGLCMGGFWAYETLGWGGFWAWDPVENVSFVPWIFMIAFVHGLIVQINRKRWIGTNILLGGFPFVIFTFGTLMTRSGMLGDSSKHSFAEMNRFALWILAGIMFAAIAALIGMYIASVSAIKRLAPEPPPLSGVTREAGYWAGTLVLCLIGAITAFGMSYPFFGAILTGRAAAIEAHLYQIVIVWLFIPLMILIAAVPFISWKGEPLKTIIGKLVNIFGLSLGLTGLALYIFKNPQWGAATAGQTKPDAISSLPHFEAATVTAPFGLQMPVLPWVTFFIFLTTFAAIANIWRIVAMLRKSPLSIGGFVAHIGVATLLAGLIISRGLEHHEITAIPKDQTVKVLDYDVRYLGMSKKDLTDRSNQAEFSMTRDGKEFKATPGLYYVPDPENPEKAMTWPDIQHRGLYDIYLSIGAPVLFATDMPMTLKKGESQPLGTATVKYIAVHAPENPRAENAVWTADIEITVNGKTFTTHPELRRTDQGLTPTLTKLNDELYVTLNSMNAEDGSITVQWPLVTPQFPIELFYKPMTVLVFAGTAILTLGGLMAAFYRRFSAKPLPPEPDGLAQPNDATVPTA